MKTLITLIISLVIYLMGFIALGVMLDKENPSYIQFIAFIVGFFLILNPAIHYWFKKVEDWLK